MAHLQGTNARRSGLTRCIRAALCVVLLLTAVAHGFPVVTAHAHTIVADADGLDNQGHHSGKPSTAHKMHFGCGSGIECLGIVILPEEAAWSAPRPSQIVMALPTMGPGGDVPPPFHPPKYSFPA